MQQQAEQSRKQGLSVYFAVDKGQQHRINTVAGPGAARPFDGFDAAHKGCGK